MTLHEAWKADQEERKYYHDNYLTRYATWQEAAAKFRQHKNIPLDQPLFTDYTPYAIAHLQRNLPGCLSEEDWAALCGLAQHADNNIDFQRHVLHLIQHQKGTCWSINGNSVPACQYLEDRININTGRPQRYGTQHTSPEYNS